MDLVKRIKMLEFALLKERYLLQRRMHTKLYHNENFIGKTSFHNQLCLPQMLSSFLHSKQMLVYLRKRILRVKREKVEGVRRGVKVL